MSLEDVDGRIESLSPERGVEFDALIHDGLDLLQGAVLDVRGVREFTPVVFLLRGESD